MINRFVMLPEDVFRARVRLLSVGFFLLFTAFSAGQLLQTAVNGQRGYLCLVLIYVPFAISAIGAPYVVGKYGPSRLLPLAASGYVLFVAANIFSSAETLYPGCTIVGLSAAVLWSSQGTYLGRAAQAMAKLNGKSVSVCASDLNATFFAVFMSSGGVSSLFASAVMLSVQGEGLGYAVQLLFLLLTAAGIAGCLVLALLPEPDAVSDEVIVWSALVCSRGRAGSSTARLAETRISRVESFAARDWDRSVAVIVAKNMKTAPGPMTKPISEPTAVGEFERMEGSAKTVNQSLQLVDADSPPLLVDPPTILDMLRFLCTQRRLHMIAPAIMFSGAGQGYILGAWMAAAVARGPGLGASYVGVAGAVYSFVCAGAIVAWRAAATKPHLGRSFAFAVTCALQFGWLLAMAAWLSYTGLGRMTLSGETEVNAPLLADIPPAVTSTIAFLSILVYGLVDTVWNGFVPATLQTFFPARKETPCAMAAIRICYSIGFSVQQAVSLGLGTSRLGEQCMLLAAFLAAASASMLHLHRHVMSLDGLDRTVPLASAHEPEDHSKDSVFIGSTGSIHDTPAGRNESALEWGSVEIAHLQAPDAPLAANSG